MQMTAFDFVSDSANRGASLSKLAKRISQARKEAASNGMMCLLFDNGDTFQGTPVTDFIARTKPTDSHPMVGCMNYLGYDAAGLGNHDFDHGLDYLSAALRQCEMPVVCSNLRTPELPTVKNQVVLQRPVALSDGTSEPFHVGVLASLPDRTALWSRHNVQDRAQIDAPLAVLQRQATELKAQGADLVIVLAHMGLALFDEGSDPQNQVGKVAEIPQVDVVIGGHTHLRFPHPDHAEVEGADTTHGTIHGKPLVQPGHSASDLGVIDLTLRRSDVRAPWRVAKHTAKLISTDKDASEVGEIRMLAHAVCEKTRAYLSEKVAWLDNPIHSYFALAAPSAVPALLAAAKRRSVELAISETPWSDHPLLAAASTPLTGGFDGPENFICLGGGQILRRHVAGMNPYANHVWAVKTTGAQIIDWLERSALIFNTLQPDNPEQLLIDPHVPGFRFDAIYGLRYKIDPRNEPCFDTAGRRLKGRAGRISDVVWNGQPIEMDQEFVVATTDHRAGGGGHYRPFSGQDIVVRRHAPLQDAVISYLGAGDAVPMHNPAPWSFSANMGIEAILLTAPAALDRLNDIQAMAPVPCGMTEDGFLRLRLKL